MTKCEKNLTSYTGSNPAQNDRFWSGVDGGSVWNIVEQS
jgi:hypothetical protein